MFGSRGDARVKRKTKKFSLGKFAACENEISQLFVKFCKSPIVVRTKASQNKTKRNSIVGKK